VKKRFQAFAFHKCNLYRYIAVLLFLFLLVFSIVGLHVFGGLRDAKSFRYGIDDPQFGGGALHKMHAQRDPQRFESASQTSNLECDLLISQ
jgi:hypothetical protein